MQKGLGVIIATKSKKGKLMTDTVVSCDAKFFSVGSPCVLQTADFTSVHLPSKLLTDHERNGPDLQISHTYSVPNGIYPAWLLPTHNHSLFPTKEI